MKRECDVSEALHNYYNHHRSLLLRCRMEDHEHQHTSRVASLGNAHLEARERQRECSTLSDHHSRLSCYRTYFVSATGHSGICYSTRIHSPWRAGHDRV